MRKLLAHRPSAGAIIGFIALCVALGGGAYAAKKKIEYKGLTKDARLKALPVSSTNANTGTTPCDPTNATTYVDCTQVSVDGSTAFPRHYLIVFTGVLNGGGAVAASGECRLELDKAPLNGTTNKIHTESGGDTSVADSIVTTPQGGKHTISVACNETNGDVKLPSYQLSAIQVR